MRVRILGIITLAWCASVCSAPREAPAPDNSAGQLISQARKLDLNGQQVAAIAEHLWRGSAAARRPDEDETFSAATVGQRCIALNRNRDAAMGIVRAPETGTASFVGDADGDGRVRRGLRWRR